MFSKKSLKKTAGGAPGLTRTSTATSNKDRGLAEISTVHSKWDRYGGTGMS